MTFPTAPAQRVLYFIRTHVVLTISAAFAVATLFFVPIDEAYLSYIDWKTLGCLFCVLAVANAFRLLGAFDRIGRVAIEHLNSASSVCCTLVVITAVLSMVATNDMALLIMLPLSATTLAKAGWAKMIPATFVLQNLAANLCGMIVPFGNPQNLYLYSYYSIGLFPFLKTMALPFVVSVLLIGISMRILLCRKDSSPAQMSAAPRHPLGRRRIVAYSFLLILTALSVFRIIPVFISVIFVFGVLLYADSRALKAVDYSLLLTFVCFFIFAGNMARIPAVSAWLETFMKGNELLVAAGLSQVISNVPAAVLLSHFTSDWQAVLMGVNIGGAGTVVGSLASLITLQHFTSVKKIYPTLGGMRELSTGYFMKLFAILNFGFLFVLLLISTLSTYL